MPRLNTNQKRRKRRGRRRERDRRWLARGERNGYKLVTCWRRWVKVYGKPEDNTSVMGEVLEFFEEGGSDVSVVRVIPEGAEVDATN